MNRDVDGWRAPLGAGAAPLVIVSLSHALPRTAEGLRARRPGTRGVAEGERARSTRGRSVLSPIRFEYDSETFSLPIRLGLANVDGDQDLTVYVLGQGTRYEAANYENALIPTNLRLVEGAKERFG